MKALNFNSYFAKAIGNKKIRVIRSEYTRIFFVRKGFLIETV